MPKPVFTANAAFFAGVAAAVAVLVAPSIATAQSPQSLTLHVYREAQRRALDARVNALAATINKASAAASAAPTTSAAPATSPAVAVTVRPPVPAPAPSAAAALPRPIRDRSVSGPVSTPVRPDESAEELPVASGYTRRAGTVQVEFQVGPVVHLVLPGSQIGQTAWRLDRVQDQQVVISRVASVDRAARECDVAPDSEHLRKELRPARRSTRTCRNDALAPAAAEREIRAMPIGSR